MTIQSVDQGLADSFGLKSPTGALVSAVEPDGPAAKAGLEPGDVILKFNGQDIDQTTTLPELVASLRPGTKATLHVWRNGATKDVSATIDGLGDRNGRLRRGATGAQGGRRAGRASAHSARAEGRASLGRSGREHVAGPAAKAGIEPGDVIVAFNGTPVKDVEQLRALVGKAGKHFALLVKREDATIFIPITMG